MVIRIYKLLIVILLLSQTSILFAQNQRNTVKDSSGEPIAYATIIFSQDSTATEIIDYTISDSFGTFTVPSKVTKGNWLTANMMGYKEYKVKLLSPIKVQRVVLESNPYIIGEVVVKGHYWGVKTAADTIKYDATRYATGSERNIGEVLSKMPGLEVSETGKVSYGGKPIDKVLVDGKDILSSGDGLAINSLSADLMQGADILLDYQSNSIADQFNKNETVALDIRTNGKQNVSGSVEGGYGYNDKFLAKFSIISVKEPFSFSLLATANNIGDAVFSMDDYIKSVVGLDNILSRKNNSFTLSEDEKRMLLPPDNTYDATNGAISFGATYQKTNNFKFKGNILYNGSLINALSNENQYYYDGTTNQSEVKNQNKNHFLTLTLQEDWRPSSRFELSSNSRFSYGDYNNNDSIFNSSNLEKFNSFQSRNSSSYNISQQLNMNYQIGDGILYAYADIDAVLRDENYNLNSDSLLFINSLPLLTYPIDDNITDDKLSVRGEIGYILPIYKDINLNTSLAYHGESNSYSKTAPSIEKVTLLEQSYMGNVSIEKTKGLARFSVGGLFKKQDLQVSANQKDCKNYTIEPNATLALVFSPKHKLTFGASYSKEAYSINYFSDSTRILSYNQLLTKSKIDNPYSQNINSSLQYFIFDLYSRTSLFLYSSYTHSDNAPMMNIMQDGLVSSVYYTDGAQSDLFVSKASLSKGLGFMPADIKLNASYTYTETMSSTNSIINNMLYNNTNVGLSLNSRYNYWLNFEIEAKYGTLQSKSKTFEISNNMNEWSGSVKLKFHHKKFKGDIYYTYDHISTTDYNEKFNDIGFNLAYELGNIDLQLMGRNLLNINQMEWVNITSNELYSSQIYYRKIPGCLMLSLKYRF